MVVDSSGLSASVSHSVNVIPRPEHDVALSFINVFPNVAISSTIADVEVGVLNTGSGNDTVSVTVYANSIPVSTLPGIFIQAPPPGFINCPVRSDRLCPLGYDGFRYWQLYDIGYGVSCKGSDSRRQ